MVAEDLDHVHVLVDTREIPSPHLQLVRGSLWKNEHNATNLGISVEKMSHEIKFGNHKFTRISGSGSCRRCAALEGLVKIFILSSWMAADRISWRGKPSALISFGSFREGIILNVFSKGLAYFLL